MKDSVLGFGFRYFIALLLGILALSPSAFSQDLKPLVFDTPEITLVGEDARAQLLVYTPASTDGAVIDRMAIRQFVLICLPCFLNLSACTPTYLGIIFCTCMLCLCIFIIIFVPVCTIALLPMAHRGKIAL